MLNDKFLASGKIALLTKSILSVPMSILRNWFPVSLAFDFEVVLAEESRALNQTCESLKGKQLQTHLKRNRATVELALMISSAVVRAGDNEVPITKNITGKNKYELPQNLQIRFSRCR
ncbi:hypothetical protein Plhal304r1_c018g0064661 [Plasmopara halstedii]